MDFVIGNLPENTKKKDIARLLSHCRLSNIEFLKKKAPCKHSDYDCVVTLGINDPVAGAIMENHLNSLCLNGCRIHFHRLIF